MFRKAFRVCVVRATVLKVGSVDTISVSVDSLILSADVLIAFENTIRIFTFIYILILREFFGLSCKDHFICDFYQFSPNCFTDIVAILRGVNVDVVSFVSKKNGLGVGTNIVGES